jgi:rhamnopyranosyl-N-acetylglucosaminyl-diphospho-decaprenol beta-1,3/1,4-galactofuranosyltransferase
MLALPELEGKEFVAARHDSAGALIMPRELANDNSDSDIGRSERVCAVILTMNRKELLRKCLSAVLRQNRQVDQIVVVCNGCSDGTSVMLTEEFPNIQSIELERNVGAAGGFNAGVAWAYGKGYDWYWLFDDDVEAFPDALEALLAAGRQAATAPAILAPKCLGTSGAVEPTSAIWNAARGEFQMLPVEAYRVRFVEADVTGFAGPLIARRAVASAGLPRPELFFVYEDWDWCCRLRNTGSLLVCTDAIVVHHCFSRSKNCLPSSGASGLWRFFFAMRNEPYVIRQHFDSPRVRLLLIVRFLRCLAYCLLKADQKLLRTKLLIFAWTMGYTGDLSYGVMPGKTVIERLP